MSTITDNTTVVRRIYDDFGRGDIPAVLEAIAPDVVWTEAAGTPYGGVYHGPQAVVDGVFTPFGTEWDGFVVQPERLVADGDTVIGTGTYHGTYRATGRSMTARFAHVFEMRDGRLVRFEQIADSALMVAAVR